MRKTVFITGAARRIGATVARYLHPDYDLILHYHHSVDDAHALANELNQQRPGSVSLLAGELTTIDQATRLASEALAQKGRIDVLINNASAFYPTPIGQITADDWQQLVGTNMLAPLFISQQLAEELRQRRGHIINMCDIFASQPLSGHTLYCMAKAALVMMTRSLAKELAPDVLVNGIAPGAILWPEKPLDERDKQDILQQIPLQRLGSPADIAATIAFLIGDNNYITGEIIAVDGGRQLGNTAKA